MSSNQFNNFGHLKKCHNHNPRALRPKTVCAGKSDNGKECDGPTCHIGCIKKDKNNAPNIYIGYCNAHWCKLCGKNEWDSNISYCANVIADEKDLDMSEREKINQFTINEILDIPDIIEMKSHIAKDRFRNANNAEKQIQSNMELELCKLQQQKADIEARNLLDNYSDIISDEENHESEQDEYEKDSFVVSDDSDNDSNNDSNNDSDNDSSESSVVIVNNKSKKRKAVEEIINKYSKKQKK